MPKRDNPDQPPELDAPAVAPEDVAAFEAADADVPDTAAAEPEAPPKPAKADYAKVVRGVLGALDRGLSFVLRVHREDPAEIEAFVEMITPAAQQYGPKLGARFWAIIAGVGFLAFVLGKIARRVELARPPELPAGDDGRNPLARVPVGVRGAARYPPNIGDRAA